MGVDRRKKLGNLASVETSKFPASFLNNCSVYKIFKMSRIEILEPGIHGAFILKRLRREVVVDNLSKDSLKVCSLQQGPGRRILNVFVIRVHF